MLYKVAVADPPWKYWNVKTGGNLSSGAASKYPVMDATEIAALPVAQHMDPDSVLIEWATWPLLPSALMVMNAWGFQYVTGFPWIKVRSVSHSLFDGDVIKLDGQGMGFWVRGCSEAILIGKRGRARPPINKFIGLLAHNIRHSRKPDDIYQLAESFPGPYLELFARRRRQGWDAFGNEIKDSISL